MKIGRTINNFIKIIYYFVALGMTSYGLWSMFQNNRFKWLPIVYIISSLIVLGLYEKDKLAAKNKMWRIPESTLHFFEFIGGWVGAFWAQLLFRHKTRKISYQFTFWIIVTLHLIFWTDYTVLNQEGISTLIKCVSNDFNCDFNFLKTQENNAIKGTIEWSK